MVAGVGPRIDADQCRVVGHSIESTPLRGPRPQRGEQRANCGLKDREHPREGRAGRCPCHPRIAAGDTVCWPLAIANEFFVTIAGRVPRHTTPGTVADASGDGS